MKEYLELFKNGFDGSQVEKCKPENGPYVGHNAISGEVVYTIVPEPVNEPEYELD